MKRGVSLAIILFILISNISLIISLSNDTDDLEGDIVIDESASDEKSKVDNAYACLENKVRDKCSDLSTEEKIFSVLAVQKCKNELIADSQDNKRCWPKTGCTIKATAQAILALDQIGVETSDAEKWLLSQNMTPPDVSWYLQIHSHSNTATCTVGYSGVLYSVSIYENKQLSSSAGNCLALSSGNYWLKISPTCLDKEFEISCKERFLTTLWYKRESSPTIYVSNQVNDGSAEGTTSEKVNSLCFSKAGNCDYEGSLWATFVLNKKNYDVSLFMPYLMTMATNPENTKFLPESFLYSLTDQDDFRTDLLSKQKDNFWDASGDKFYDTAVALLPFPYSEIPEKTLSKSWLLEGGVQKKDGCWSSTTDTGFLLYSIWPKEISTGSDYLDCEDEGSGYCMRSKVSCEGQILEDYDCSGGYICCDLPKETKSCIEDLNGEICNSRQECIGGTTDYDTDDLDSGESCCINGHCENEIAKSECETNGGACRSSECDSGETKSSDDCGSSNNICCVVKKPSSNIWIWIIGFLILLVVLGIIFKDKLRPYWFKIKSKFWKSNQESFQGFSGRPTFPPASSRMPVGRPILRRILPPSNNITVRKPVASKSKQDIDEVLKKLKDMGS